MRWGSAEWSNGTQQVANTLRVERTKRLEGSQTSPRRLKLRGGYVGQAALQGGSSVGW
jgi:hypothetical protein